MSILNLIKCGGGQHREEEIPRSQNGWRMPLVLLFFFFKRAGVEKLKFMFQGDNGAKLTDTIDQFYSVYWNSFRIIYANSRWTNQPPVRLAEIMPPCQLEDPKQRLINGPPNEKINRYLYSTSSGVI